MFYRTTYVSPIGKIKLLADRTSLLFAYFEGQAYFEEKSAWFTSRLEENAVLKGAISWLDSYFKGHNPAMDDLNLSAQGTDFQTRVWKELLTIPYGETRTYGQLASLCDCPSAQAVGAAIGKNPLLIFVPCHRVLSSTRKLTGYSGGLEKKAWLLDHELERE
ncbi:methylated-DNA--[protein]-cysteine S-methyltransferase [Streptococcus saliviloxodontae]|uniref:Methylated-DNA-[protein]-cysteine S-methyltransferase n=1 Tax=Streptococcus saliviloxodontae TaxID=1349416 RepID=A0ABS2PLM9_9STRE|nr:methylated-DNA--[protein]-cysteine S-methyltransferase [Streptococcus saliviloxodontae]MBM7636177.1 methylated-DNA-[protein]-cysteine S-methyltransferase [Streptococcus saliviloxodontae]